MDNIIIENEKFFWNENNLLEHVESKTTFNDRAEAEKWVLRIIEDNRKEGGL